MTQLRRSILLAATLLACGGLFASSVAHAEDTYPSRPIRLVVGYPPGGPTDVVGRVIARELTRELGQQVIVDNLGGAGGTTGALSVARAAPDGYTLLTSVEASQTRGKVFYPRIAYDQVTSFTFLRKLAKQRALVVVNPASPFRSIAELIAYAKQHPTELNYGGTLGTTTQLVGSIFSQLNGIEMTMVSYPGGNQPITDLMAGTLQVGFLTEGTVSEQIKAGKLRALAVAADDRSLGFPDLPTVAEAGGKIMDVSAWFGVVGPAGLPPAISNRLVQALNRIEGSPDFTSQLQLLGAVPIKGSTPQSFEADVKREIAFWTEWAKENTTQ